MNIWARLKTTNPEILYFLFLFFGALALYALNWPFSLSDGFHNLTGGKAAVGAERVLAGEIPYRDYWTMYAPGQFYLLAFLFSIFGSKLMVEVVAASVICATTVYVCYRVGYNLTGRRFASLVPGLIYFAATYNTGYVKRLGSYPTAALLIFVSLNLTVLFWKSGQFRYLISSGLVIGLAAIFKHDVAGYTAIAIIAGHITYSIFRTDLSENKLRSLLINLAIYAASIAVVFLPVFLYFVVVAGPDMLQDLIVFPLTDFRFVRPEGYPSLLPLNIVDERILQTIQNFVNYIIFLVVFVLFLLGILAIVLAVKGRKPLFVAAGITISIGFLLHYIAAHTQINTHIITMSVYGALVGLLLYDLVEGRFLVQQPILKNGLLSAFVIGWLLVFFGQPGFIWGQNWVSATEKLSLPKVQGFKVSPVEAQTLTELTEFVNLNIPLNQPLYVGLHRHDAIVIGDVMIYYILDRPNATRYHELHPGITDIQAAQQEIINDLNRKDVHFIILRQIFSDDELERVKATFKKNIHNIGATDLDIYIQLNYQFVRQIGPYSIWERMVVS